MQYIDLTHLFTEEMPVYPGDSKPRLEYCNDNGIVHYKLKSGMHIGTHMDGPLHMIDNGKKLSQYPPEKFIGNGSLIDARGQVEIGIELLQGVELTEIVLVFTGWSEKFRDKDYYEKFPSLTKEFANALVAAKINIIGLDTPSPDTEPFEIHKILLGNDILIIENLTNLKPLLGVQQFEITALPTKFEAEAAPARVVAKIL